MKKLKKLPKKKKLAKKTKKLKVNEKAPRLDNKIPFALRRRLTAKK